MGVVWWDVAGAVGNLYPDCDVFADFLAEVDSYLYGYIFQRSRDAAHFLDDGKNCATSPTSKLAVIRFSPTRRDGLSSNLKNDDIVVCVHTIQGNPQDKGNREFIQPDVRSSKPSAFYIEDENQTAFFQKVILTSLKGKKFGLASPNEIAMSLSIASKSRALADTMRKAIKESADQAGEYLIEKQDIIIVYDFLEEIQKAIVFAYKAVESFCNASIPDSYVYKRKTNKDTIESFEKNKIERWIKTSEKLTSILPDCLGINNPNTEKFWPGFKSLERLRNDIVHSKSSTTPKVLAELFSENVNKYIDCAIELIEFFVAKDPNNPIFPLGFGISKVQTYRMKKGDVAHFLKKQ